MYQTQVQRPFFVLSVLAALLFPVGALGQGIRSGSEFLLNSYTTSTQSYPAAASDGDGDFVVVWLSYGQDGSSFGVFGRRFTSEGATVGGEFQVNSFTPGLQLDPAVAMDADGDFVVAWLSKDQDGSDDGIFGRRYSSSGAPVAGEFQVNTYTMYGQSHPSVALDADGDFVVAWESFRDGPSVDIVVRRFSSSGAALTGDIQVNVFTPGLQFSPSVAADTEGDFVVVWSSDLQDGADDGVFARRFSSAGTPLGGELQVNVATEHDQSAPSVDVDADGDFIVAWRNDDLALTVDVFARRFSSTGVAQTGELQVNLSTGSAYFASVATDDEGDFVVTWSGANGQDGSAYGVFARNFSSAGAPVAAEFQVNTHTPGVQRLSSVAADAEGDFVIAWQSHLLEESSVDVFAQRFGVGTATGTATATATVTPTATQTTTDTQTPTTTSTPTATSDAIPVIPTLSRGAMAVLTLLLLAACLTFLVRSKVS